MKELILVSIFLISLLVLSGCSSESSSVVQPSNNAQIQQQQAPIAPQAPTKIETPTPNPEKAVQPPSPPQPSIPVPQTISLHELFSEAYSESKTDLQKEEIRQQWVGKLIKSSGKVNDVREAGGQYWVTITNPSDFSLTDLATIYLKSKEDALKIQKGAVIKFVGEIDGFGEFKGITIRNTEIRT